MLKYFKPENGKLVVKLGDWFLAYQTVFSWQKGKTVNLNSKIDNFAILNKPVLMFVQNCNSKTI